MYQVQNFGDVRVVRDQLKDNRFQWYQYRVWYITITKVFQDIFQQYSQLHFLHRGQDSERLFQPRPYNTRTFRYEFVLAFPNIKQLISWK